MGITFLPHSYLNLFSGVENLACYPLDPALQASWKLVIGYPDSRLLSRCAKEFISFLKQKMQPDEANASPAPFLLFLRKLQLSADCFSSSYIVRISSAACR